MRIRGLEDGREWLNNGEALGVGDLIGRAGLQPGPGLRSYLNTFDDTTSLAMFGKRSLFADLDQRTLSTTGRANVSLSPRMSLQVYTQLLLSRGRYWRFKELLAPNTYDFGEYGTDLGTIARSGGGYTVDPDDAGKAQGFTFDEPDFDFKSLRVNAVFRWEWKPGSTAYVVWTQTRQHDAPSEATSADREIRLFGVPSYNVFLVKITYWFNR